MQVKRLILSVIVSFYAVSCSFADLILNGGMEGGTGLSDLPSWMAWGSSGTLEPTYYHSGAQSVRFWWDDTGIFQNFNVTVGQEYFAEGYFYTPSSADRYTWDAGNLTYAYLKLEWYQADNSTPAGSPVEATHFTPDDTAGTWTFRSVSGTAPATAVYGRMVLGIGGAGPGGGTVAFDDFDVTAVPEPATFALLGSGALIALLARRKRK